MSDPRAELSSINSALEELTRRVATLADQCSAAGNNEIAHELFEAERALTAGNRRVGKAAGR